MIFSKLLLTIEVKVVGLSCLANVLHSRAEVLLLDKSLCYAYSVFGPFGKAVNNYADTTLVIHLPSLRTRM